jgi:shikimate kinase
MTAGNNDFQNGLHPPQRDLLFLVGASGSGKSVIAERAAKATGWALFDTDAEILAQTGRDHISDIFDSEGEDRFREMEMKCLEQTQLLGAPSIVATGGGLPAIEGAMSRLNEIGVSVYLKASAATLWKRLSTDPRALDNRPLLRGDGRTKLEQLLLVRERAYERASLTIDTGQRSVDDVCALIVAQIELIEARINSDSPDQPPPSQSSARKS